MFFLAETSIGGNPLNLTMVSREHTGDYICIADNGIPPNANHTIKLQVQCKYSITAQDKGFSLSLAST